MIQNIYVFNEEFYFANSEYVDVHVGIITYYSVLSMLLGQRDKGLKTSGIGHGTLYPLDVSKQLLNEKICISG